MRLPKKLVGLLMLAGILLLPACATAAVQAAPIDSEAEARAATVYNGGEDKTIERSISVQGQGSVSATPDLVTLSLGVQTNGETAQEALALNSEQMTGVIAAIKEAGIADEDIQTSGINIYPVYDNQQRIEPGGTREIIGYRATNSVTITVHDISEAGSVLDVAIGAGANVASGIQFGLSDTESMITDALVAAVLDAQAKAQTIADTLGVELGKALVVTEEYIERPRAGASFARAEAAFDSGGFSAPVQGGTVSVIAHIRVTFAIE
jgi:hypothetical protein